MLERILKTITILTLAILPSCVPNSQFNYDPGAKKHPLNPDGTYQIEGTGFKAKSHIIAYRMPFLAGVASGHMKELQTKLGHFYTVGKTTIENVIKFCRQVDQDEDGAIDKEEYWAAQKIVYNNRKPAE